MMLTVVHRETKHYFNGDFEQVAHVEVTEEDHDWFGNCWIVTGKLNDETELTHADMAAFINATFAASEFDKHMKVSEFDIDG